MSIQIKDSIIFQEKDDDYIEAEVRQIESQQSIFDPTKYGFIRNCEGFNSATLKGYNATYEVKINKLVLKELDINSETLEEFNGVSRVKNLTLNDYLIKCHINENSMDKEAKEAMFKQCKFFKYSYPNLDLELDFSGIMIIEINTRSEGLVGSISDLPRECEQDYMSKLKELHFSNGELIKMNDTNITEINDRREKAIEYMLKCK